MRRLLLRVQVILLGCLALAGPAAGGNFAHGGDWLKLQFFNGKSHAASILTRIDWTKVQRAQGLGDSVDYLKNNAARLAEDIRQSPHQWTDDPTQVFCAMTDPVFGGPIRFAMPSCRESEWTSEQIMMLLIHESIHHLGVTDEQFADFAALTAVDAWRRSSRNWQPLGQAGAIAGRQEHTAVWTGREMIIFGGLSASYQEPGEAGARYIPDERRWLPVSEEGAPSQRVYHTSVWTGKEMLVWGGFRIWDSVLKPTTGGAYNPATDTWRPIGPPPSSEMRYHHSAIWTGEKMAVFGGKNREGFVTANFGQSYDPATDQWSTLAPVPEGWVRHSAAIAFTGKTKDPKTSGLVLLWGGIINSDLAPRGIIYDAKTDSWRAMSGQFEPSGVQGATVVWAEDRLLVWGGLYHSIATSYDVYGGIYDPATDQWQALSKHALMPVAGHSAVWTGDSMITWGGNFQANNLGIGAAYNRVTNDWTLLTTKDVVQPRYGHTAIWTGHEMIVWGGNCPESLCPQGFPDQGGAYTP